MSILPLTDPLPVFPLAPPDQCRFCEEPIVLCPARAEGYLTYCGGWIHVPPPGSRRYGRHSCGMAGGTRQAQPKQSNQGDPCLTP